MSATKQAVDLKAEIRANYEETSEEIFEDIDEEQQCHTYTGGSCGA